MNFIKYYKGYFEYFLLSAKRLCQMLPKTSFLECETPPVGRRELFRNHRERAPEFLLLSKRNRATIPVGNLKVKPL
jgi:hypothetical protein